MSAAETALRVLRWASTPVGSPPQGDWEAVDALGKPSRELCDQSRRLAAQWLARFRWSFPATREGGVATCVCVVAAAIGGRGIPEISQYVLHSIDGWRVPRSDPTPELLTELVARHGLVLPALRHLGETLQDAVRGVSPLTSLLDRPAPGQNAVALQTLQWLLPHSAVRPALVHEFAEPVRDRAVRNWRTFILDRLQLGERAEQNFVLDVYEAALVHHGPTVLDQIRTAQRELQDYEAISNEDRLADALSLAQWWGPLAGLRNTARDRLRSRHYLDYAYLEGLDVYRLAKQMTGGLK